MLVCDLRAAANSLASCNKHFHDRHMDRSGPSCQRSACEQTRMALLKTNVEKDDSVEAILKANNMDVTPKGAVPVDLIV